MYSKKINQQKLLQMDVTKDYIIQTITNGSLFKRPSLTALYSHLALSQSVK